MLTGTMGKPSMSGRWDEMPGLIYEAILAGSPDGLTQGGGPSAKAPSAKMVAAPAWAGSHCPRANPINVLAGPAPEFFGVGSVLIHDCHERASAP
jgi:hypothetical protein